MTTIDVLAAVGRALGLLVLVVVCRLLVPVCLLYVALLLVGTALGGW